MRKSLINPKQAKKNNDFHLLYNGIRLDEED